MQYQKVIPEKHHIPGFPILYRLQFLSSSFPLKSFHYSPDPEWRQLFPSTVKIRLICNNLEIARISKDTRRNCRNYPTCKLLYTKSQKSQEKVTDCDRYARTSIYRDNGMKNSTFYSWSSFVPKLIISSHMNAEKVNTALTS